MAGAVVGITRMVLDFVFTEPECGEPDMRPTILSRMHYMYFAMLLFNLTGIVMIIVSLCTKPPTEEQVGSRDKDPFSVYVWARSQQMRG